MLNITLQVLSILIGGGLFAYLAIIHKAGANIKISDNDLEAVSRHISGDIKRIETEIKGKAELYESNVTVDMVKDVLDGIIKSLPNTKKEIDRQISLSVREGRIDIPRFLKIENGEKEESDK